MLLENRKAHFNYEFLEKFDAGIELLQEFIIEMRFSVLEKHADILANLLIFLLCLYSCDEVVVD